MDLRKIYISTSGNMIDYMTDARIDDTLDKIWDNMSQGNYFAAAQTFVQETQAFVNKRGSGGTIVWTAKQVKSLVIKSLPAGNGNCFCCCADTQFGLLRH